MRLISLVAVIGVAFSVIARESCVDADPTDFWNAQELFKTPRFRANPYPESDYPGMRAMLVEGLGPDGTNAEFFAYFAKPEGAMPKGGFPGLLLVHGGGGTAFPTYVAEFVKDGFAVLALDWYNQRPAPALTNVPPRECTTPRIPLAGGKRQNHVANVANMVLAHSLLRSFPEVDASRTVYVGLSWGSWYGSCVTAVDNRFKGACMIYLCDRHPNAKADPANSTFVKGPFHKSMKVPSWWIVWPRDSNGLPSTMQDGWEACPCEAGRTIVHNLGHSHEGFSVAAVHRMA
ncbi:MAG: alpha/beta fold hydrolase, partial [Kiritimatiellae bacterium]|nr:alpha/beta fold hydrolase [Kiritimatiellia bacterium]